MRLDFYDIDYSIERLEDSFKIYDNGNRYRMYDNDIIFDDWYKTFSEYLPIEKEYRNRVIAWVNSFRNEEYEHENRN